MLLHVYDVSQDGFGSWECLVPLQNKVVGSVTFFHVSYSFLADILGLASATRGVCMYVDA